MPYQNNIPQPTDRLKDSQGDLLANFQALQTFLDVNHAIFADPNAGKHKWVSFPQQGTDPMTTPTEVALYAKVGLAEPEALFLRKSSNAVVKSGGFSEFSITGTGGWTRLPSGILLKWSSANTIAPNPATIAFPVVATVPVFTAVYNIQATITSGILNPDVAVTVIPGSITTTQFQVWGTTRSTNVQANVSFFYLAIGE